MGRLGVHVLIRILKIACRRNEGQNIAEYALILAVMLVVIAGAIGLFASKFR